MNKISSPVVKVNSTVRYRDKETRTIHEVVLVYPHETDFSRTKVSVLAPVGNALLGLSVGQATTYRVPDGREKTIEVLAVTPNPRVAEDRQASAA